MIDRDASADRIARAVRAGERICVFGDYDCDGITSAAIMTSILEALRGTVTPLLATRLEGSYGLSHKALARVFATGPRSSSRATAAPAITSASPSRASAASTWW